VVGWEGKKLNTSRKQPRCESYWIWQHNEHDRFGTMRPPPLKRTMRRSFSKICRKD